MTADRTTAGQWEKSVRYLPEPAATDLPSVIRDGHEFAQALADALRPLASVAGTAAGTDAGRTTGEGAAPAAEQEARPALHWDLVLVVDSSPTFSVAWADAVPELVRTLRDQQVFDEVIVTHLTIAGQVFWPPPTPGTRRVIWLLTDGAGPGWRSGTMARVLADGTAFGLVAVVDVLSAHLWDRTDLAPERIRIHGAGPVIPGQTLSWDHLARPLGLPPGAPLPGGTGLPVPVLELDADWIGGWARFVAADGPFLFETPAVITWPGRQLPLAPAGDLAAFLEVASPVSRRLAGLLCAAPAVGPRGLRTIAGVAGAERHDLSEVLALGLLAVRQAAGEEPAFTLRDDARRVLRVQLSRGDVSRVGRALRASGDGQRPEPTGSASAYPPANGPNDEVVTMGDVSGAGRPTDVVGAVSVDAPVGAASTREGPPVTRSPVPPGGALRPATAFGQQARVWGGVPPRNPHFTGREDLLAALDTRLSEGVTSVLPEALHGMGGVGKTQLAIEYVYRHMFDFDVIWWIPAERNVQIGNALIELGQELGLDVGTEANVAVHQVVEALRIGDPYDRWLLVFDNADDPQSVRGYFPTGTTSGRILVTSRNSDWLNVSRKIEVDVFRRDESLRLLRTRADSLAHADADRVASALGDLPLAVEQAATWLAETGMAADEYLRLLKDKHAELLGTAPADYPSPVTAAWNVSLDRLAQSNPAALELLQACAYFAPTAIARQLLSRGTGEPISPALDGALRDPVKLGQAIRDINRYSLARVDHRDNSMTMHRLVQQALIGRMNEAQQGTLKHGAHLLLAASDPNDPLNPGSWPTYADLYPHVVSTNTEECEDPRVRQLLLNLCDYLWWWGDHQASNDLARKVRAAWDSSFPEEDPYSLQLGLRLGWGLVTLGHYAEAAQVNQRTFELSTRVNGPNAELTIVLMGNIGADLRWRGDFGAGLEMAQDAYRRAVKAFGHDDPETLNTAHNVAVSLRLLGRYAEAAELDDDTWRRSVQLYGEAHSYSLSSLGGRTLDRRELGDYLGARVEQESLDARWRRLLDADNPARLQASLDLAVAHRKAGDHDRALALSRDTVRRFVRRYGETHPSALAASLSLSIDLRHADQLHEARELCERTLRRYTARIGETHPHTLATAINLAVIDRLSGQREAALDRDEQSLVAFVERLGEAHPSTLACSTNLASDLYALGRFQEAHDRDVRTVASSTATLGELHPSTLAVAANLALDLRALGRTDDALDLQARTLTRLDSVLDRDHPANRDVAAWERLDCDVDPIPM